ncbi:MAG: MBL fold metallo-hydrolase [Thermodesulfobacterium sp.]|nr:MBL fold metallo-hydrolase [Thermodesulfobacterium sp.]
MNVYLLGTAGARYVVAKQLRASAGTVLEEDGEFFLIDPGPGTIVHLAKHKIPVEKIRNILISHKHLDHSADLNVIVDAITEGTFKKRGRLFIPKEAWEEGVLLSYLKEALDETIFLAEKEAYQTPKFSFKTTKKLLHSAETYGFIFNLKDGKSLGFLSDTAFFEELISEFQGVNYLIVNVVRYEPKEGVLHLSVQDVRKLLASLRPELTVITHFGMTMLRANPFKVAKDLSSELNLKVLAAYDGLRLTL